MSFHPLLVVPAIPCEGGVRFILPSQDVVLGEEFGVEAWAILALCNGINTVDVIVEELDGYEEAFIAGFLDDLETLGVVLDSRQLYKRFHEVSSNPMIYPSGLSEDEIIEHTRSPRSRIKDGEAISFLPNGKSVLVELQQERQSCRSFSGEQLSVNEIGGLLDVGYSLRRHAVPSAGGLYPMKLFLLVLEDQRDFSAGYYEFDPEESRLVRFNDRPDSHRIAYALNDTGMPFGASVVILIAADAYRQPKKYSNRGYRFMAIEAGQISQNIALGAVEMGLGVCELGGFLDDVLVDELQLGDDLPFLTIAVGRPSDEDHVTAQHIAHNLETVFVGDGKSVARFWTADDGQANNFDKSYFQVLASTSNGQVTSGISTSWADAKLKAIAEAYERQRSAALRVDVRASSRQLADPWIDPRIAVPLTDDQYQRFTHLQPFDEDLEIEWVRGVDHNSREVYVPIDLVFYPIRPLERKKVVDTCSSGFAAYSTYEEAARRGLLEIVERDALMRNWYEKTSPPRLGFDLLPVYLQKRVRYWQERGREVYVLDLSQMGVIVIEVVIVSDEYPSFVSGAASSLSSFEETAVKAFYEAESRLIHGLNDMSRRTIRPEEVHSVLDHELLYAQSKDYHEHVEFLFRGEISNDRPIAHATITDLKEVLSPVVVNVSEEGSPLHVVKVLSQKLIPISFGYGADHYTHTSLTEGARSSMGLPHYFA